MNKLLNISLCLILTLNFGYSQSIKRNVISSFGTSSNTANSIVETTFGQPPNIGTISDGNNYIRQGFQQPLYNFIATPGCTDPTALNYDPLATVDDGSCCYASGGNIWNQIGQDIDGNTYQTVAHGNIEIMAENLKVESFNNGDPIPEVCYCGTNINSMCSGPGWTFYACQYSNLSYGRLYIGYTIADSRNVCPSGWHIATANEWIQLLDLFVTEYLPNGDVDVSAILSNQSNESGLSILLGGHQGPGGASWANGQQQYESLWYSQGSFSISINVGGFPQNSINPNSNFSGDYNYNYVRCVKD